MPSIPKMGMNILINSFLVVVLGGLGSLTGSAIGAFFVALTKSIGGGYFAEWSTAFLFLIVALALIVRPTGVFGQRASGLIAKTTDVWPDRASAIKTEARTRRTISLLIVAGAALLALLPFVGVAPFTITLLTEAMIFAIWAMSLDLMTGYTGMLTFGHAAGFGLGAYAAGYFAREVTGDFLASLLVSRARRCLGRVGGRLCRYPPLRCCVRDRLAVHRASAVPDRRCLAIGDGRNGRARWRPFAENLRRDYP